jgi:NO-binding membrane sensor protein with MHYT domain
MVQVHNFSYGVLNPLLGYAMSSLGAFLGLRCITRARAYTGRARAPWLMLAAVSVGATGIWAMHFIAMLGFSIPGEQIRYNIAVTIASMLISVAVVGVGLFIVGYGSTSVVPLLGSGVIIGIGVATMHYMGMAAMSMPSTVRYNDTLVAASVLIAIIAGTAALWAGLRVSGIGATVAASLVMGVAVTGMHYTGMAAMRVYPGTMSSISGATAASFLLPLLLGVTLVTFTLTLLIALSPTEDEIREDALQRSRLEAPLPDGGVRRAPGSRGPRGLR